MFNTIFSKDIFTKLSEPHTFTVVMTGIICSTVIAATYAICHYGTDQFEHPMANVQKNSAEPDQESEEVPE